MRIKRAKAARKQMAFFRLNFNFKEPYYVLIDGTFMHAALECRISLREQLPVALQGKVQLVTTLCVRAELQKLGKEFTGSLAMTKPMRIAKCGHKNEPIGATQCLQSILEGSSDQRYVVATQDVLLRRFASRIPGVATCFIKYNTILLEPISAASNRQVVKMERAKQAKAPLHIRNPELARQLKIEELKLKKKQEKIKEMREAAKKKREEEKKEGKGNKDDKSNDDDGNGDEEMAEGGGGGGNVVVIVPAESAPPQKEHEEEEEDTAAEEKKKNNNNNKKRDRAQQQPQQQQQKKSNNNNNQPPKREQPKAKPMSLFDSDEE